MAIRVTEQAGLKVHTYTAPESGWLVNTHFVELPTQLIAIDAQYMLPYAKEAVAYAAKLGKPIKRLYVTHYHPDHLLGAAAFGLPIHALSDVKTKINTVGDRVASEEHDKFPELIASHAERPGIVVPPGSETIEGVRFEFLHLEHAETEHALMIGIPDHRILITQDLIYNGVHAFIAERAFDAWSASLQRYNAEAYEKILPGHGGPGGRELFDHMLHYLGTARDLLSWASDGDELRRRLVASFPAFGGQALLDHQNRFLFRPPQEMQV